MSHPAAPAGEENVNITVWLHGLGLQQYEKAFRDNAIDAAVLPELTTEDLRDIGVGPVGHRRKLLAAIAALRDECRPEKANRGEAIATAGTAERRQLTIMFCDLVGSTALSARLDPEDLRELITLYHRTVTALVTEFGGFVARYMGDGILIYFGYPKAHEDDAEQAVRAGLSAIDAIHRVDVRSVTLQARVGIATGLVVVGDLIGEGSAQEQSVIGETPNLAAGLQALALPGTVVIAGGTHRLVGNLFECRELGAVKIKGSAAPVHAWQVLRPSTFASRFEALHRSALPPLIGRDEEIDLLLRRWARAKAGDGQVVLISGEPGIGKSRIVAELEQRLCVEPHVRVGFFCSQYHQDSALFPFIQQLSQASQLASDDPPAVKLEKLEALLARAASPDEDFAFLADLLSLPISERHPLPNISPQRKKDRTLEAVIRQVEKLSRQLPVVAVVEDAHWIDPTSRELLDLAVDRIRTLPVLLVVSFRPEFQPPWIGQPRVTVLALNRLDRRDRIALVEQIAGGKPLPIEVVSQITDRTDGVPLFVEELTKSVLESGVLREELDSFVLDRTLPPLAIPTTLQDSLMARLDRSAMARQVAQVSAAIGREFSYALLRTVCRLSKEELEAALVSLVASELVFQRGAPPEAVYTFKHALVQDVAYGSLLRSSRRELHAQIADALETDFPELIDSQPELFARHYAEAGLIEKSVVYWGRAGQKSAARSAMAEAAAQLQKGLDQLELLPETPERKRQKLEFCSSLGAALRFVKGQATPEMGHAFVRARELWEQLGSPPQFLHIPYGQSRHHTFRGEYDLALRLDENLLRLSRQHNDAAGMLLGHDCSGRDLLLAGKFVSSRSHFEQVLALYDPISHGSLVNQIGSHPHVISQGYLAIALFCLGFPDRALAQSNAAVAEALRLAHPPTLTVALSTDSRLLSLSGDSATLDERASQLIAVANEQGFPLYQMLGTIYRGWAKVNAGDVPAGISLLRSGSSAYSATGVKTRISYHIALLAEACKIAGQVEEAVFLLDEALQTAERIGEFWFASELYRHKGELMLRRGNSEAAEDMYRHALAIAKKQDAKLWELRVAISVARLHLDQDRGSEARDFLAAVYGWFTEGFDTQDLKSARALLDQLTGNPDASAQKNQLS
jgi:class 3 adenylate cyclase/predicted ATPase